MMNSTQSPSADYYLDRYEAGSDRWTRLKETDKLADAQISTMSTVIRHDAPYTILDVGCGTLWTSFKIAETFPNVRIHGIDFAYEAIIAQYPYLIEKLGSFSITFGKADLFTYRSDSFYDCLCDIGLFHHLVPGDWERYAAQIDHLLRPGGSMFLHTFHTSDANWNKPSSGGHIRKGYYCHYHDLSSLGEIFGAICSKITEVELCSHEEHIVGLYHMVKAE